MATTFVLTVDANGVVTAMQRASRAVETFDRTLDRSESSLRKFEKGVSSFRRAVLGIEAIFAGFGLSRLIHELIQVNVAFDRVRFALIAGNNSTQAAAADFDWLRKKSAELGLEVDKVGIEYAKFAAAAKGTALQGQPVRDVFESVAKASIAMGIDMAHTQRIFMALTQMLSKGRVQAEEARQQFGEHLPGGFRALGMAAGFSVNELGKFQDALRKGQVDAVAMMKNLPKVLDEMFGPAFREALMSPAQAIKVFSATWKNLVYDLGQSGGFMREFSGLLLDLGDIMRSDEGRKEIERLSEGLGNLMHVVREATVFIVKHIQLAVAAFAGFGAATLVQGIAALVAWLKKLTGATSVLGLLIKPWSLLGAAVGTAVFALIMFNNKMLEIGKFKANTFDWAITGFQLLGEKITESSKKLYDFITSLPGLGQWIKKLADDIGEFRAFLGHLDDLGFNNSLQDKLNAFTFSFKESLGPLLDWWKTFWATIQVTARGVLESLKNNLRSAIDALLSSFGTSLAELPAKISAFFGSDMFKAMVDGAQRALNAIVGIFFGLVESAGIVIKLVAEQFNVLIGAFKPIFDSIKNMLTQLADAASEAFAGVDVASGSWGAIGKAISVVYDLIAGVVAITQGFISVVAAVAAAIWDALVSAFQGVWDVVQSVFGFIFDAFSSLINLSSNDAPSAISIVEKAMIDWLDRSVGGLLILIRTIGVTIDWLGALIGTLIDVGARATKIWQGFEAGFIGLVTRNPGLLKKAGDLMASAFTEPFTNRFESAIQNTEQLISSIPNDLHVVSNALKAAGESWDSFQQRKGDFARAFNRFGEDLKNPQVHQNAGKSNADSYWDSFLEEWGKRAQNMTEEKARQKAALDAEKKRLEALNEMIYAQDNSLVDRSLTQEHNQGAQKHHGKTQAEKAMERIRDLQQQMRSDQENAMRIAAQPMFDPTQIKAADEASSALRRADYPLTFGEAIKGSDELAKKLANVAFEASVTHQQFERLQNAEKQVAENTQLIDSYQEQIQLARDLTVSTNDYYATLEAQHTLREKGLNITVAEARELGGVQEALVETTIAAFKFNVEAKAMIATARSLREFQQVAKDLELVAAGAAKSELGLAQLRAEQEAQQAVMDKWGDEIFDATRLNDAMTKSLYDQTKAISLMGGSVESLTSMLKDLNDQYRELTQGSQAAASFKITDEASVKQAALDSAFGFAQRQFAQDMLSAQAQMATGEIPPEDFIAQVNAATQKFNIATQAYQEASGKLVTMTDLQLKMQSNNPLDAFHVSLQKFGDDATNIAQDLQKTWDDAFNGMADVLTNFVMTGKLSFGDLARSVIADIARMIAKWLVWQAIKTAAMFLGFADGGVMTSSGPKALPKKYARGGVANSPQVAVFGEGSMPEAYVPLPDGRTIPVSLTIKDPHQRTIQDQGGMGGFGGGYLALTQAVALGASMGIQNGLTSISDNNPPRMNGVVNGGASSVSVSISTPITIQGGPGQGGLQQDKAGVQDPKALDALSRRISSEIKAQIIEVVRNETRPGGAFNPMGTRQRF